MNVFVKTFGFVVTVCVACVLLAACGGSGGKTRPGPIAPPTEREEGVDVEAILATSAPQGIDEAIWEMLKAELVGQLRRKTATQMDEIEINLSGERGHGIGVAWDNRFMHADGSGNGIVDIADLSPIAMHYGSDEHYYADYDGDGRVNLADIVVMARSFGFSCSGFCVGFSTTSKHSGFNIEGAVAYADYAYLSSGWRRIYQFPCETRGLEPLWIKVWVLDNAGEELGYKVWEAPLSNLWNPPMAYYGGFELVLIETHPPTVRWSTANVLLDGNQDGNANMFDVWAIGRWLGSFTDMEPLCTVVDYSLDGHIDVSDVTPFAMYGYGRSVGSFVVEVSAVSAEDGFIADGTVDYFDSAGFNEFGFRYYEYTVAAPPESEPYWVRVVPYSVEDERGAPGTVVQVGG